MFWDSMNDSFENMQSSRMSKNESSSSFRMEDAFDKENGKFDGDLSMYEEINSPSRMSCDGSPVQRRNLIRRPLDLENHDPNSQDSGYSAFDSNKGLSPKSRSGLSFGSMASMEDEFLDISELESDANDCPAKLLPGDFNKLITGSLVTTKLNKLPEIEEEMSLSRPPMRRALSMITNSNSTPNSTRVRSCLFSNQNNKEDVRSTSFKRPEPPSDLQSPLNKRCKLLFGVEDHQIIKRIPARPLLQRSTSATEDSIKSALQRSTNEPDLIGDFSKPFSLPLVSGRHQDLKSITPATLAELMRGDYSDNVASFKVVDCRYPYEFEGGHIAGAHNLYTKQQVLDELVSCKTKNVQPSCDDNNKRHVIVFHCEFSSERAPNLSRYLRNIDRSQNKDFYPFLHYPEVYLLDGGYKNFYETQEELCAPSGYLPMSHPEHEQSLRYFRSKSKTWNADTRSKTNLRSSSFKRL